MTQLSGAAGAIFIVFAFIGWLVAGTVAWTNLRYRVGSVEAWQIKTDAIIAKQVGLAREVEINSRELKIIAANGERRLKLVEDRLK